MPCSLIDSTESLYAAYRELIARCCPEMTPISTDQCALTSVRSMYEAVQAMITSESCGKLTATDGAPDPGELPACISGDWLAACEAWIRGMSCTPTGICEPEQTCVSLSNEPEPLVFQLFGSLNAGLFDLSYESGPYTIILEWSDDTLEWKLFVRFPGGASYYWSSLSAYSRCDPSGYYTRPSVEVPPEGGGRRFVDASILGFC